MIEKKESGGKGRMVQFLLARLDSERLKDYRSSNFERRGEKEGSTRVDRRNVNKEARYDALRGVGGKIAGSLRV